MNPNSLKKKKIIGIKSVQFRIVLNESNKNIFIHCDFGKSRSASVVIFYVMKEKKLNFNDAKNFVKNIRNQII